GCPTRLRNTFYPGHTIIVGSLGMLRRQRSTSTFISFSDEIPGDYVSLGTASLISASETASDEVAASLFPKQTSLRA
ncbi:MAG TPA: hypothetical protein VK603_26205, partial [Candidatus Saccharimonadales bacterium]|nr:hypothetical protein [Candidatus Saccharimonadales bacterium]